jgi:hypothetical protein
VSAAAIHGIPGLTTARLGELWSGVLHVTQDTAAICHLSYFAKGGMAMEIYWKQGGIKHHYPAVLPKERVDAAIAAAGGQASAEDALFRTWATEVLEAVRVMGNLLAGAAPPEEAAPDFTPPPGAIESFTASLAADDFEEEPQGRAFEVAVWSNGEWRLTPEVHMGTLAPPEEGACLAAVDFELDERTRRAWIYTPIEGDPVLVAGMRGYVELLDEESGGDAPVDNRPPQPDGAPS